MREMKKEKQQKELSAKQGLKQCPKCSEPKPFSEFSKDKSRKDELQCLCKEHDREYRDKNKKEIAKKDKERYIKNKEKIAKRHKKYYINNKEKINKQKRRYQQNKRKTNINFRIKASLRTRISHALKGKYKSLPTMFLIGCDTDYLMYYIQNQFAEGMTWNNYGIYGWHIDHIKPCTKFDLSRKSEQFKCFHYSNLQPLWAEDNLRKGIK